MPQQKLLRSLLVGVNKIRCSIIARANHSRFQMLHRLWITVQAKCEGQKTAFWFQILVCYLKLISHWIVAIDIDDNYIVDDNSNDAEYL